MASNNAIAWREDFHKALSNPIRLQIVDFLLDGQQCQCEIFPKFGLAQSTVSAYLTQLVRAGILKTGKDGTRKIYSLTDSKITKMIQAIRNLANEKVSG
jgi:DNA-binding transcriptional ArsR family regulator